MLQGWKGTLGPLKLPCEILRRLHTYLPSFVGQELRNGKQRLLLVGIVRRQQNQNRSIWESVSSPLPLFAIGKQATRNKREVVALGSAKGCRWVLDAMTCHKLVASISFRPPCLVRCT